MKLSNFIFEQSLGDATVSDIVYEQTIADINVLSSILNCYDKMESILEYYEKMGIDSSNYVMEGIGSLIGDFAKKFAKDKTEEAKDKVSENTRKFGDIVKEKWKKLKAWFAKIKKLIEIAVNKLIDSLSHVNFKFLIFRVKRKFDKDSDFKDKINPVLFFVMDQCAEYTEKLLKFRFDENREKYIYDRSDGIKNLYDEFTNRLNDEIDRASNAPLSRSVLIDKLEKANEDQRKIVGLRTLLSRLNLEEFKPDKDSPYREYLEKTGKEMRDLYETFAKRLAECYMKAANDIKTLIKLVGTKNEDAVVQADVSTKYRGSTISEPKPDPSNTSSTSRQDGDYSEVEDFDWGNIGGSSGGTDGDADGDDNSGD